MGKKKNKDRWPELCERVQEDDGLPTRQAGSWTEDKLFRWNRYLEATTKAMHGNPNWPGGLIYVDLFGGPGVCENNGKRFPGSALIASMTPAPFSKILVCEKGVEIATACKQRLEKIGVGHKTTIFSGDCNVLIDEIVKEIPPRSLTLAFVDPESLHIHFETLRKLTTDRRVDLLILFADRMDIHRNVKDVYYPRISNKLDLFLGEQCDWRSGWDALSNHDAQHSTEYFTNIYKQQLERHLRYVVFGDVVIRNTNTPIYKLIFASKNHLGLKLWDGISKIDRHGQKNLF